MIKFVICYYKKLTMGSTYPIINAHIYTFSLCIACHPGVRIAGVMVVAKKGHCTRSIAQSQLVLQLAN